jgi:hypothetical protein
MAQKMFFTGDEMYGTPIRPLEIGVGFNLTF